MSDYLYNEHHNKVDTFSFKINAVSSPPGDEKGIVSIVFENGKFKEATFPMRGLYSRRGWKIIGDIAQRIDKIEVELDEEAKVLNMEA